MFSNNDDLVFVKFVSDAVQSLENHGLVLRCHGDFDLLRRASKSSELKPNVTAPFDAARNDILPHTAFWLSCEDSDGKLVLTQAVRLYDLGDVSLADFWRRHYPRILLGGKIGKQSAPATHQIRGKVVYHGEGWAHPDYRSNSLSPMLGVLAQALSLNRWWPDYIFGLCEPKLQKSGFQIRLGYAHCQQAAVDWTVPAKKINGDSWIVWNTREDLKNLIGQSVASYL